MPDTFQCLKCKTMFTEMPAGYYLAVYKNDSIHVSVLKEGYQKGDYITCALQVCPACQDIERQYAKDHPEEFQND